MLQVCFQEAMATPYLHRAHAYHADHQAAGMVQQQEAWGRSCTLKRHACHGGPLQSKPGQLQPQAHLPEQKQYSSMQYSQRG